MQYILHLYIKHFRKYVLLQKHLVDFTWAKSSDLIDCQCIHLLTAYAQNALIGLENESKHFKQKISTEHNFCEMGQQMDDYALFDNSWSAISSRYPLLCNFFVGLACTVEGTSIVKSDFSIIRYEKDDYCSSLANISIEAILPGTM